MWGGLQDGRRDWGFQPQAILAQGLECIGSDKTMNDLSGERAGAIFIELSARWQIVPRGGPSSELLLDRLENVDKQRVEPPFAHTRGKLGETLDRLVESLGFGYLG